MVDQKYFTALEIAELAQRLRIGNVPSTKRGVQKYIEINGWDRSPLCRDRQGRGGGREYHWTLFPEHMVNAMLAESQKEQALLEQKRAMAAQQNALVKLGTTELTARQRSVMEARAAIVNAVSQYQIEHGASGGQAVTAILEKCVNERALNSLARAANDRAGQNRCISKSQLYQWIKLHKEQGIGALAPKATKDTHSFPAWFSPFMAVYAKPQAPSITDALDHLRYKSRINSDDLPSYDQVRRSLKKLDKTRGTQARHRGREGSLQLKARHAYVVRDTSGLMPTSVYTADGKIFDAEVQHPNHGRPFRPEITSI
ncbi:MAG: hypothetical protein U5K75_02515 [Ahrensia sp.]|nr:hypothetical protein [Ahrensia sp.]